ncbi:hypothetical protein ACXY7D_17095 [Sphingomonas melonis]|uniref:hypothetical protein n=1 Tax=uncultured Sphingomonas sp. TaxID=158754 RepID=UPI0025D8A03E|nr:hypothetical protein [uncultured Sphingomonas sp.]
MTADIRLLRWPERDREEYERLVSALERVRASAARSRGEIVAPVPAGPEEPSDADRARTLLAQRRQRDAMAGDLIELFGEPGWDILLTLFVAYEEARPVTGEALGALLSLRPAVLARWLDLLARRALIRCAVHGTGTRDPATPLALTDDGLALVLRCIGGA